MENPESQLIEKQTQKQSPSIAKKSPIVTEQSQLVAKQSAPVAIQSQSLQSLERDILASLHAGRVQRYRKNIKHHTKHFQQRQAHLRYTRNCNKQIKHEKAQRPIPFFLSSVKRNIKQEIGTTNMGTRAKIPIIAKYEDNSARCKHFPTKFRHFNDMMPPVSVGNFLNICDLKTSVVKTEPMAIGNLRKSKVAKPILMNNMNTDKTSYTSAHNYIIGNTSNSSDYVNFLQIEHPNAKTTIGDKFPKLKRRSSPFKHHDVVNRLQTNIQLYQGNESTELSSSLTNFYTATEKTIGLITDEPIRKSTSSTNAVENKQEEKSCCKFDYQQKCGKRSSRLHRLTDLNKKRSRLTDDGCMVNAALNLKGSENEVYFNKNFLTQFRMLRAVSTDIDINACSKFSHLQSCNKQLEAKTMVGSKNDSSNLKEKKHQEYNQYKEGQTPIENAMLFLKQFENRNIIKSSILDEKIPSAKLVPDTKEPELLANRHHKTPIVPTVQGMECNGDNNQGDNSSNFSNKDVCEKNNLFDIDKSCGDTVCNNCDFRQNDPQIDCEIIENSECEKFKNEPDLQRTNMTKSNVKNENYDFEIKVMLKKGRANKPFSLTFENDSTIIKANSIKITTSSPKHFSCFQNTERNIISAEETQTAVAFEEKMKEAPKQNPSTYSQDQLEIEQSETKAKERCLKRRRFLEDIQNGLKKRSAKYQIDENGGSINMKDTIPSHDKSSDERISSNGPEVPSTYDFDKGEKTKCPTANGQETGKENPIRKGVIDDNRRFRFDNYRKNFAFFNKLDIISSYTSAKLADIIRKDEIYEEKLRQEKYLKAYKLWESNRFAAAKIKFNKDQQQSYHKSSPYKQIYLSEVKSNLTGEQSYEQAITKQCNPSIIIPEKERVPVLSRNKNSSCKSYFDKTQSQEKLTKQLSETNTLVNKIKNVLGR